MAARIRDQATVDREAAEAAAIEAEHRAQAEAVVLWRVIEAAPGQEGKVIQGLRRSRNGRDKVVAYVPMETVFRATGPRGERITLARTGLPKEPYKRPLIRGYVFDDLDDQAMASVHELEGARKVMMVNGAPAGIWGRHMLELIRAEAAGRFDLTRKKEKRAPSRSDLDVGDEVRVEDGPLKGFLGVVIRLDGDRRARVMSTMIGWASRIVNAELADLELVRKVAPVGAGIDSASESRLSSGPTLEVSGGGDRPMKDTRPGGRPIQSDAAA